jgi:hypothetical protein
VKFRQNPPSRIGQIRQKSARNWDDFRPFFTLRVVFVGFLVRILPYLRSGQGKIFIFFENILHNLVFLKNILHKIIFLPLFFFARKSEKKNCFIAYRDSKTARIRQPNTKQYKMGQIRQKSARNWESARNIFCPLDNFQIRQNCPNLAEKTAIWQRCMVVSTQQRASQFKLQSRVGSSAEKSCSDKRESFDL